MTHSTHSLHQSFINLKNRNARAKELRAKGYIVNVFTMSNQQLHPMYIEDWEGEEKNDTGFGNTVYRTSVAKLYCLHAVSSVLQKEIYQRISDNIEKYINSLNKELK